MPMANCSLNQALKSPPRSCSRCAMLKAEGPNVACSRNLTTSLCEVAIVGCCDLFGTILPDEQETIATVSAINPSFAGQCLDSNPLTPRGDPGRFHPRRLIWFPP